MGDWGLLILRVVVGGLLIGHGTQKLFGWFGGHGLTGVGQWMESMGLRPGRTWALMAGLGEAGGGLLLLLGFLNPLGSIGILAAMSMASIKVHWGKPIWVTEGGAELPLTNMAAALAVAVAGPGEYALDSVLGLTLPMWLVVVAAILAAATVAMGATMRPAQAAETATETQREETEEQLAREAGAIDPTQRRAA